MTSQLNIDEYFVDRIVVDANNDLKLSGIVTDTIDVDYEIKRSQDKPLDFMIRMLVELNKDQASFTTSEYRVILDIVGFLSFVEGTDEALVNKMIAPSGLSILYGIARGVVSQVTGNFRHGKFILPALNFVEIIQAKGRKAKDAEAAAAVSKTKPLPASTPKRKKSIQRVT